MTASSSDALLILFLKTAALTSSGLFAGYTWALSDAAVPAVLLAKDPVQAAQWREQYLAGFYISRPLCVINFVTFSFLAYLYSPITSTAGGGGGGGGEGRSGSSLLRSLYLLAAFTTASGVPYALTFLRRVNGAMSLRAHKVAGRHVVDPIALTYARDERPSVAMEAAQGTAEMVRSWRWHNSVRTFILVFGTVVGALAVSLS